jgi:aminomethyltransferase
MANQTALYAAHLALDAKLIDFGGWEMPVEYPTRILREHAAVRAAAGLFDTGHMGELLVEGSGALASLQALVSRDLSGLENGQGRYTLLMTERGTVLDDLIVFKCLEGQDGYYVVTNAGTREADAAHIKDRLNGARLTDLSPQTQKLDLQGPKTFEILAQVCKMDLRKLKRFRMTQAEVAGVPALVSASGYTGEPCGIELFFEKKKALEVWSELLDAGESLGLLPCGLGARDTLRLEACLPLYGHELSTDITPFEAGLEWAVSLDKNFTGRNALLSQKEQGLKRMLAALKFPGRQPPRGGQPVFAGEKYVGLVTSGTYGPTTGCGIALALVEAACAAVGTKLQVESRGTRLAAEVVKKPFYKRKALASQ